MAEDREREVVSSQFGGNLRRHRRAAGLSQEEVAALASLHRTEIGLVERGRREPRVGTLVKLAAALSVTPLDLLDGIVWELPATSEGRMRVEPPEDE